MTKLLAFVVALATLSFDAAAVTLINDVEAKLPAASGSLDNGSQFP